METKFAYLELAMSTVRHLDVDLSPVLPFVDRMNLMLDRFCFDSVDLFIFEL